MDPRKKAQKRAGEHKEKKAWKRNAPIAVAASDRTLRQTTLENTKESEQSRKIEAEEEALRQEKKQAIKVILLLKWKAQLILRKHPG